MVKNLTDKIVQDSRKKAEGIIQEAEKKLEKMLQEKKEAISKDYAQKLAEAKKRIDAATEREISNYRLGKEKELLACKNGMLQDMIKKIEEEFNLFLGGNLQGIITGITKGIKEKDCVIKVPETSADITIEGFKVEKDAKLSNAFLLEGKNWSLLFNWERFSAAISDYIKEKTGSSLFGKNEDDRRS